MSSTLVEQIEQSVIALRQQHEIEVHQTNRLEQYMEAHKSELVQRIRGIRARENFRRQELVRELELLAQEIGVIPPRQIQAPQPPLIDDADDLPAMIQRARQASNEALNGVH